MGGDLEVAKYWNTEIFLFPVVKEVFADPADPGSQYDFYGGQAVNQSSRKPRPTSTRPSSSRRSRTM